MEVLVVGGAEDSVVLPAGPHSFPFQFQLPPNCPTAFEGPFGNIRYHIKAEMDIPWGFNQSKVVPLPILGLQDLSLVPSLALAVEAADQKSLGCLCCAAGTISATAVIPRGGFVVGEEIPVKVQVANSSSRGIKSVRITVMQRLEFIASGKSRSKLSEVVDIRNEKKIAANSTDIIAETLILPACVDNLVDCSIINIVYYIRIRVIPAGASTSLEFAVPFAVGTSPVNADGPMQLVDA